MIVTLVASLGNISLHPAYKLQKEGVFLPQHAAPGWATVAQRGRGRRILFSSHCICLLSILPLSLEKEKAFWFFSVFSIAFFFWFCDQVGILNCKAKKFPSTRLN
jgi:hypothetical protein